MTNNTYPVSTGSRREATTIERFLITIRRQNIMTHIMLIFISILIIVPIWWITSASFKSGPEFYKNSASLIPNEISTVNYQYMFSEIQSLPIYMRNSFILAIGVTLLQVVVASLAGYAFARMEFRGRNAIFLLIVVSIFIPRGGGLMALYEMMSFFKLRNSLFGLILLFGSQLPIPIFIMRQAFLSIPKEIEESAFIDGANRLQVFFRIALPLAVSAMVVVATLAFVGVWSDFLITFTMIDQDSQLTISVGIQKVLANNYSTATAQVSEIRGQFANEAANSAMLLFSAIPVIIVYAILQRWFMRGLTEGAVKF